MILPKYHSPLMFQMWRLIWFSKLSPAFFSNKTFEPDCEQSREQFKSLWLHPWQLPTEALVASICSNADTTHTYHHKLQAHTHAHTYTHVHTHGSMSSVLVLMLSTGSGLIVAEDKQIHHSQPWWICLVSATLMQTFKLDESRATRARVCACVCLLSSKCGFVCGGSTWLSTTVFLWAQPAFQHLRSKGLVENPQVCVNSVFFFVSGLLSIQVRVCVCPYPSTQGLFLLAKWGHFWKVQPVWRLRLGFEVRLGLGHGVS